MKLPNMKEAAKRTKKEPNYIYEKRNIHREYNNLKYYIRTYGCQMNVHDTEEISAILEALGYTKTENYMESDLIILNTCAIRENVHDKVFGFLGRCKNLKKKNPNLILGLCGCMAQEEKVAENIKEKYPFIDIVFGTHNINELPVILQNYAGNQSINVYSIEGNVIEFDHQYKRDSKITAWVNIMYGCDKFCSYCIVPYTRGKQRSRRSADILKEINDLIKEGYQEVTLLGQNVNAYGKDLEGEITFSELLEKVSLTGIPRIRFVTSHPWDFTDEMTNVIAKYSNIMPYIHLPIQAGSNRVLKLMNRNYTKEDYLKLFDKIKDKIKNVSISTDIIVAFPGETEEDFEETLDLANYCKFDGAYTFIFSPREGTPAAKMKNELTEEEKKNRLQRLNKVINKYSKESNLKLVGTVQKVLVIGLSDKDTSKVCGYTENMKLVNIEASHDSIGQIIDVEITEAKSFSLNGKIKA